MNKKQNSLGDSAEDNIDFLKVAKIIWAHRRLIIKIIGLFCILGLFISILTPKTYTASSTFVPQVEGAGKGGNLGGLASLAGINLSSLANTSEIPPSLYPKIINSVSFKRTLLATPINVKSYNIQTTYGEFYEEYYSSGALSVVHKYTIGLPQFLWSTIKTESNYKDPDTIGSDSALIKLTKKEVEHFNRLENQIQVIPNDQEGTVELSFEMPEALMSAEMAQATVKLLQQEVIAFKIQNAKEQLKYTQEQFDQKKEDFRKVQQELALFRDRNQNISSAVALNKLKSLEAEYNFAFNIYTEMAKQLEQTKIQVSKNTPVFSIINPVSIPVKASAPNRILIVIVFTCLGMIFALGYVFFIEYYKIFKQKWLNENHGKDI